MSKQREIQVRGFKVEVHDFGYASFYYPSFNRNAEFKVTPKGFRQLSRYLGLLKWIHNQGVLDIMPK